MAEKGPSIVLDSDLPASRQDDASCTALTDAEEGAPESANAAVKDAGTFCPHFHHAVELLGRRWNGVIIRAMLFGAMRYSDIQTAVPTLSSKMLTERLKELEAEGVVQRIVIPATPVRIEYHLTEKGRTLDAVIAAVEEWSERCGTDTRAS